MGYSHVWLLLLCVDITVNFFSIFLLMFSHFHFDNNMISCGVSFVSKIVLKKYHNIIKNLSFLVDIIIIL